MASASIDQTVLHSDAARSMMPGLAAEVLRAEDETAHALDIELRVLSQVRALRLVKTWPGSGDMAFIAGLRGKRYAAICTADRERIARLAWRYRVQLPAGLRPLHAPAAASVQ